MIKQLEFSFLIYQYKFFLKFSSDMILLNSLLYTKNQL